MLPGECEKQLVVRDEATNTDIMVHLLDGWMDTPAEAGDLVHVLADVIRRSPDEMGHATCSASSGGLSLAPIHAGICKQRPTVKYCQREYEIGAARQHPVFSKKHQRMERSLCTGQVASRLVASRKVIRN